MTAAVLDFSVPVGLRDRMRRVRTIALFIGLIGAILLALAWVTTPAQFYRSYLWAYVFVLGAAIGSLAWLMAQYCSGGAWGVAIRRPAEAAARTLPLLILLFVPIIIGHTSLYPWAHPELVAADPVLKNKQVFLNLPFWLIRAAVILGGFTFLAWYLNRWSLIEEREGPRPAHRKMARLSGPGIVFWGFAATFMAIDWMMSLNPDWFSTMFGMMVMAGQGLTGMAFLITVLAFLSYHRPLSEVITWRHLHDVGKLMFANVIFFAYLAFSQFLITWAGNLPEEIPWYVERLRGGWEYIGLALVLGHFALPFALLLSRDLKTSAKPLVSIAIFVLVMRMIDVYWFVIPDATKGASLAPNWVDLAALIGIGGIWTAWFLAQLEKRALIPINDIHIVETLEHGR